MMKEYLSPAGEKPCLKEGESNDAAVEPIDVTSAQVPAELQGHTQPATVAPVETRKSKMKTRHLDKEDQRGGPSQPAGEPEVEIITESLSYENLRNLQKDIARGGREAFTSWLLQVWVLMSTGMQLDGTEARNLGPLTQDSGVDQIFVREQSPLPLWKRLFMSVRERFVNKERMEEHHHRMQWKTLEEGIQQLREVAVLEVRFGRDGQHDNDPDKVSRVQATVCFHLEGHEVHPEPTAPGWKHSPSIGHGLIQAALEKGEAPEHLQYIDDIIVWGNTAVEVFEKGEKIIQILLGTGFAIKKSKVKGPAREIQFLGVKWKNGQCQIPTEVINKITTVSPPTSKKETQAFLGATGFWTMHIPEYSQIGTLFIWSPARRTISTGVLSSSKPSPRSNRRSLMQ
ncbi:hypothetical protein TURU_123189 [Turdus rufiventris]|nr:hypothetical protein TURU_123189 [Turdus rufiventris]